MSAWICYCSLRETKSLNMFSRHWKTVMFGFAPKQCTPFKTHEMESFKSHGRTCPHPPPWILHLRRWSNYASGSQTHSPRKSLSPDLHLVFLSFFYFTMSYRSAILIATLTPAPSLVKTSFYLLFSTPSHVIYWTQPQFGPSAGLYYLVSASRNTVLHSCRLWLNEPVSPNLLLNFYGDGVINWLLLNHLKLRRGKHRLVAWQWRSTDHS